MHINPLTQIDFYKADHRRQYPTGTEFVYSNFTPRSTKHMLTLQDVDDKVVFFGLQYFIKHFLQDCWNQGFFALPKDEVVKNYKRRMDNALGKDSIPVDHIEALHDLGYLPICIKALPEGSVLDEKIPMLTICNTKPEFFWLVNYLETVLSAYLWKPCTSATTARKYKILLTRYARLTGGDESFVNFQGHDFSFRGMSGIQDAVMSGAGHLLSFQGSDTVPAIDFLEQYYFANSDKELVACSVPASEHSVMCMGGNDGELQTFDRFITELYPAGIVSIVSDTWDFWQVVTDFLPRLKAKIVARQGKVVIRPDSGDPVKVIVGDLDAPKDSPEYKGAIECLWETFGGSVNAKGYKELDSHIGLIYGDSITLDRCQRILEGLKAKGFASTNVVLGIGSFTYEYVTRDSLGFAVKATYGKVNGEAREIFKSPKTDSGFKKSARGLLTVSEDASGKFFLEDQVSEANEQGGALQTVFLNGELIKSFSLAEIRDNLKKGLPKS